MNDQKTLWEVPEELWQRLVPLLVIDKTRKKKGRPAGDDRAIFNALIWLARTGGQGQQIPRPDAPQSTVHERFKAWVEHGCLHRAWAGLLQEYGDELGIDWEWQAQGGSIVKAPLGKRGPPERRKRRAAIPPTEAKPGANERF